MESGSITEAPTEAPKVEVVRKPRSEAQVKALEAARTKALELRAQKTAQKASEAQKATEEPPEPPPVEVERSHEDVEEPIEYVRKARSKTKPKKKRVIVVEESSSSDSEIEVRLPKRKDVKAPPQTAPPMDPNQVRFERAYEKMFSI